MSGLSGSGKSTLAEEVQKCYPTAVILDGDEIRKSVISNDLDHSPNSRVIQNERIAYIARKILDAGGSCIVTTICPDEQMRQATREYIGADYILCYVDAGFDCCARRDVKGLYEAKKEYMVGSVQNPYEVPERVELWVDTEHNPVKICASQINLYLYNR